MYGPPAPCAQCGRVRPVVSRHLCSECYGPLYERGEHIVDPHTGRPPSGVRSVTVCGPDLGTADAYSTAAFAMGTEGPKWTLGLAGYHALTVLADDVVLSTPGFPASKAVSR